MPIAAKSEYPRSEVLDCRRDKVAPVAKALELRPGAPVTW
jgi:hypothetical protein